MENLFRQFVHKTALVLLTGAPVFSFAQDIHFSQFFSAPLVLNPALTGQTDGELRFTSHYRNQWTAISPKDYTTFAASLDAPVSEKDFFAGVNFFNDRSGDSRMGTNAMYASFATTVQVDKKNTLSLGIQPGWAQRSIDVSRNTWDSQYDGEMFNSSLPTGENIAPASFSYFDIASGFYWKSELNKKINLHGVINYQIYRYGRVDP